MKLPCTEKMTDCLDPVVASVDRVGGDTPGSLPARPVVSAVTVERDVVARNEQALLRLLLHFQAGFGCLGVGVVEYLADSVVFACLRVAAQGYDQHPLPALAARLALF